MRKTLVLYFLTNLRNVYQVYDLSLEFIILKMIICIDLSLVKLFIFII